MICELEIYKKEPFNLILLTWYELWNASYISANNPIFLQHLTQLFLSLVRGERPQLFIFTLLSELHESHSRSTWHPHFSSFSSVKSNKSPPLSFSFSKILIAVSLSSKFFCLCKYSISLAVSYFLISSASETVSRVSHRLDQIGFD